MKSIRREENKGIKYINNISAIAKTTIDMEKLNDRAVFVMKDNGLTGLVKDVNILKKKLSVVSKELEIKEVELRIANKRAEESEKLKSSFLANISHEIRTPLNGLMGFIQLIQTNKLSLDKQNEGLQIMKDCGYYLLDLMDNLIDISKIDSNNLSVSRDHVSIEGMFKNLDNTFRNSIKIKDAIDFSFVSLQYSDYEQKVFIDECKTKRALYHLINNAIKFTEVGKIEFGCEKVGSNLVFFVKDTGIGIDENHKKIVLENFRQVDEGITRKFGGLGLGLTIAKEFIKIQGGEMWFDSVLNKGTDFFFSIPL
jgi:signal transduction histidine kinase